MRIASIRRVHADRFMIERAVYSRFAKAGNLNR